ncbi:hypothetical protein CKM354_000687500 [Cercospora kikuchii]|uniref:Uncharacterized protein n=1 Tax=Cercospora kikuchii TaxID=84275 RepID=A0A9P3CJ38_9PEZI|nr:uncharacterized protein CKM354_000687500 [Cercospora kikuchii]GIZ43658.1 hypothetical protein CKM354_000687500 [Cercospora kikuchii]
MKSFIIASGLISLASATAIPKAQKPPGLPVDPNAHPTLIYVDTATEEAKGKRCGTWEVTEGQKNTFWPICTVWLPDPSHQEDYTLVVASIVKGKCPQWTLLAKGNYVTPYCGGHGTSSPTEFLTIHQLPPQQGKRGSSVQGQQDKRELARDDDEKPSSPPYASGLVTSTVYATGSVTSTASSSSGPAIETASSSTSSVTKTGSSSSAVGTIPPTELVKLIAPLSKQVEQIEAELRQAKGQLRKLDPNNPLAMGGAEEDESKEDSKQSEEKPNTDRRRAESVDEEPEKDLDDDLRNLMDPVLFIPHSKPQSPEEIIDDPLDPFEFDLEHIWESKSQNTKRQFPPGPAPKFDTTSGQTVASLTQKITKLTEELKAAKSQLQACRTTQKHQNEHPMETEEALGYGQGTTMTPVRPKQPQKQEQAAQGATVVGEGQKGGGGNKKEKVDEKETQERKRMVIWNWDDLESDDKPMTKFVQDE